MSKQFPKVLGWIAPWWNTCHFQNKRQLWPKRQKPAKNGWKRPATACAPLGADPRPSEATMAGPRIHFRRSQPAGRLQKLGSVILGLDSPVFGPGQPR